MVAGKQTVFLLPVARGALAKRAILGCATHLGLSKIALSTVASFCLILAAGCMWDWHRVHLN